MNRYFIGSEFKENQTRKFVRQQVVVGFITLTLILLAAALAASAKRYEGVEVPLIAPRTAEAAFPDPCGLEAVVCEGEIDF